MRGYCGDSCHNLCESWGHIASESFLFLRTLEEFHSSTVVGEDCLNGTLPIWQNIVDQASSAAVQWCKSLFYQSENNQIIPLRGKNLPA